MQLAKLKREIVGEIVGEIKRELEEIKDAKAKKSTRNERRPNSAEYRPQP